MIFYSHIFQDFILLQGAKSMKRLTFIAIAATVISNSTLAFDNVYHIYLGLGGGYALNNQRFSTTANSNPVFFSPTAIGANVLVLSNVNWKNHFNNGAELNIAVGAPLCQNWRGDGEFLYQYLNRNIKGSYNWNELNPTTGTLFASQLNNHLKSASSIMNAYSFLANGYYDFKNNSKWTPSLGAGIGVAWVHSRISQSNNNLVINDITVPLMVTAPTAERSPSLSSGMIFAAQAKAQLAYQIDSHISIVGQYRLFGTTRFKAGGGDVTTNPATPVAATFHTPGKIVKGLLTNGFDINIQYTI